MSDKEILANATIEDVLPTLISPESYIRGVFGRLRECKMKYGTASVRIGTTGNSLIPDYRVGFTWPDSGAEAIFGAFYGDNHSPITTLEASNGKWSIASMTYDEVQNLLGKVRGWKGNKR